MNITIPSRDEVLPGWRKMASAAASGAVAENAAIEKAFMDQAYAAVQNKLGPLMRPPHMIGFEIVHKNDAATRMVGMFGCRAGSQLFYAPVFFLSGEIKGTDLLYRHLTKTFVPNTEEWVVYLIEGAKTDVGAGISKSDTAKLPVRMDLQTLAYPPLTGASYYHKGASTYKGASVDVGELVSKESAFLRGLGRGARAAGRVSKKPIVKRTLQGAAGGAAGGAAAGPIADAIRGDEGKTEVAPPKKVEPQEPPSGITPPVTSTEGKKDKVKEASRQVLHDAWEEFFDGMEMPRGVAEPGLKDVVLGIGPDAVEKLASLIEASLPFATAMHQCIETDKWMPMEMITRAKEAAEAPVGSEVPVLSMSHFGTSPEFAKFGFEIKDDRKPRKINTVYEDQDTEFQSVSDPGTWSILMSDCSAGKAYVMHLNDCSLGRSVSGEDYSTHAIWGGPYDKKFVVVMADGKQSKSCCCDELYGCLEETAGNTFSKSPFLEEASTGKAYRLVDPHGSMASVPFLVKEKKERNGVTEYRVRTASYGPERLLVVNPDVRASDSDFQRGTLSDCIRFIEVALSKKDEDSSSDFSFIEPAESISFDEDISLGDGKTLDAWVLSHSQVKKASIKEDPVTGEIEIRYGDQVQRTLSKMAAAGILTAGMHLDRDSAYQILGDLQPGKDMRRSFYLWEKQAAQLRLKDQPAFQTYVDNDFGLQVDPSQAYILQTEWEGPEPPTPRIGDAWDPTLGRGHKNEGLGLDNLLNMEPDQIAQMASDGNTPSVFEHGVIGSLIHTFDASALLQGYLPKLEDAVDALGRALFLFYWKPQDFEISYGADDMLQLENQFSSNFKSLGAILLELLKRSRNTGSGNNTSTG